MKNPELTLAKLAKALKLFLVATLVWGGLLGSASAAPDGLSAEPRAQASQDLSHHAHTAEPDQMGAHHSGQHTEPATDPDCLSYCLEMLDQPYVQTGMPALSVDVIERPVPVIVSDFSRSQDLAVVLPRWSTGPPQSTRSGSHKLVLTNARLRL